MKQFNWSKSIRLGLIAGSVGVLIALIGMVEEFDKRYIIANTLTMGWMMLFIAILVGSYISASNQTSNLTRVVGSAVTGFVFSLVMCVLVFVLDTLDLRKTFVNASPTLVDILTFDNGIPTGLIYLIATGTIVSVVGGVIYALPEKIRRAVSLGIASVAFIGLMEDLILVPMREYPLITAAISWMFGKGVESGLSVIGAIVVFIVVAGGNYWWSQNKSKIHVSIEKMPEKRQRSLRYLGYGLLVLVVLYLPAVLGLYLTEVVNATGLFILMGLGLNIVVGFAGLLDLGYVAFYAIGAYIVGVLTNFSGELSLALHWNFWLALPIAVFGAILFGVILGIPVLNMRGDYLAIVTLGFGEIIRILALSDFLKPAIGGSQGIVNIPPPEILGIALNNAQTLYYFIVAGCVLALFISQRLRDSRLGRSWKAMREDEDVAQAMGINLVATKLLAFATGAAFSGLSGSILAIKLGTIYPHSFSLLISINVLALIIVGGMGSIPGVFIGALLLAAMPELLREFSEYRLLIYGALLVVMMQIRPEGFWPEETHKRELHETEKPLSQEVAQ